MKSTAFFVSLLALTLQAQAADSCGLTVAGHLARSEVGALSKLMVLSNQQTQAALVDLAKFAGELSILVTADKPRFERSTRRSVVTPDQPVVRAAKSERVNALSSLQGPVQLQVEIKPDTRCAVLALHLEFAFPSPKPPQRPRL